MIFIRALSTELTNLTLLTLWLQECWCVDLEVTVSNPCRTTSHGLAPGLSAVRQINQHSVDKGKPFCVIQWIEIFLVGSIIHLLNNWGLSSKIMPAVT